MNMKVALIITFILIGIILSCSLSAEDYLIGGYVYNKNTSAWADLHAPIAALMQEAGYNACLSTAVYSADTSGVNSIIRKFGEKGQGIILEDYIFDPSTSSYGARTLTMGNYYRFEAEFFDDSTFGMDATNKPENFFYKSTNANNARVGDSLSSAGFSNEYCWLVNNGQAGYAYQDLTYKWPIENSSNYYRVGHEFRFPFSGASNDTLLFNNNTLYISFAMRVAASEIAALPDTTVLAHIRLTNKGTTTNSTNDFVIPHFSLNNTLSEVSYIRKSDYQNNYNIDSYGNRVFTYAVPFQALRTGRALVNYGGWDKTLVNLNPTLYWYGQGTLRLDYIEIQDSLYKYCTANQAFLTQLRTFDLPYLYGYDEPAQGQFDAFKKVSEYFNNYHPSTKLVSAIHQFMKEIKKTNGNSYNHRKAYYDAVQPLAMMVNEYPFTDNCSPDWTDSASNTFVQKYITKVSDEYRKTRTLISNGRKFIAVPQLYGEWNAPNHRWSYLMPPDKVAKSLQFLPLCYKADGIVSYEFFEKRQNQQESDYYSLVNTYQSTNLYITPQYQAIKDANSKIKSYGKIIKELDWVGDDLVMPEPRSVNLSAVLLNSLIIPPITNPPLYQGFVQAGLYTHPSSGIPYVMLVNRRANTASTHLYSIAPKIDNPTDYLSDFNSNCLPAPPQTVRFTPNQDAYTSIGRVALFDPYDSTLYQLSGTNIDVPIGPGDGKLLKMVATLPGSVSADTQIHYDGFITNNVNITNQADVVFAASSDITIYPNVTITVGEGCSLSIYGKCTFPANVHIIVNSGGVLNIGSGGAAHVYTFGNNSYIDACFGDVNLTNGSFTFNGNAGITNLGGALNISNSAFTMGSAYIKVFSTSYPDSSGSINVTNSTFDKSPNGVYWGGFWADDISSVHMENTTISNAVTGLRAENTDVYLHNTRFRIPTIQNGSNFTRTFGLVVPNQSSGRLVQITADDSTYGFIGLDGSADPLDLKTGMFIQSCRTNVRGMDFHNLYYGMQLSSAFAAIDSISYCQFDNCVTGIYIISGYHSGTIAHCRFTQIDSENRMTGIRMEVSAPAVRQCEFYNLRECGISTRQSVYINQGGISQCNFFNCGTVIDDMPVGAGLESFFASNLVTGCIFNQNITGILNHAQSNLNLTHQANNIFNNKYHNIKFSESFPYQAWIQIYKGHNDFYHTPDPEPGMPSVDFAFDGFYFNGGQPDIIDANDNWFQDNTVRISPDTLFYLVEVHDFDPEPNTEGFSGASRFFTALEYEFNQQFNEACILYKDILNYPLPGEEQYYGSCVDGIFRIGMTQNYPVNQNISYFETKILQYAVSEPYLSKLLEAYLVRELILGKYYQEAIDIIQPRIDNPVSEIDSLRAVLDIELIIQLASMDEAKRPLVVSCPQYKYPDVLTYAEQHNKHWMMMLALLNKAGTVEIPVPAIATLYQNYPNPFNPSTIVSFAIPKDIPVTLSIYNIKGQLVKELCQTSLKKGYHKIVWDGRDERGQEAGSGLYLVQLQTNGKSAIRKAMLLK